MTDAGMPSGRGPLRWWLLLVLVLAMAALATLGRETPVRALDATPVVVEPSTPLELTNVRAI